MSSKATTAETIWYIKNNSLKEDVFPQKFKFKLIIASS